jgi:hypothetical protein
MSTIVYRNRLFFVRKFFPPVYPPGPFLSIELFVWNIIVTTHSFAFVIDS